MSYLSNYLVLALLFAGCTAQKDHTLTPEYVYGRASASVAYAETDMVTTIPIDNPDKPSVGDTCPSCDGSGRSGDGISKCNECNGDGRIDEADIKLELPVSAKKERLGDVSQSRAPSVSDPALLRGGELADNPNQEVPTLTIENITWFKTLASAVDTGREPLFIYFTTDNCRYCELVKKACFQHIASLPLLSNFVCVEVHYTKDKRPLTKDEANIFQYGNNGKRRQSAFPYAAVYFPSTNNVHRFSPTVFADGKSLTDEEVRTTVLTQIELAYALAKEG